MSVFVSSIVLYFASDAEYAYFDYANAVMLFGFASFLELCGEPFFLLASNLFLTKLRMYAETVATIVRCVVIYFCVRHFDVCFLLVFIYFRLV